MKPEGEKLSASALKAKGNFFPDGVYVPSWARADRAGRHDKSLLKTMCLCSWTVS